MIKLKEIRDWAGDLKPILFDINLSLNNLRLLEQGGPSNFRINYYNTYITLLYQQHFILVIQLTKFFSEKNDTYKSNFNKLFNKFQNEKLSCEVLSQFNSIHGFKNEVEILEAIDSLKERIAKFSEIIENVITLRDKVFAHSDPSVTNGTIDIQDLIKLVELCNNIYNTLIGNILGEKFNPAFVKQYDLSNVIELLER